MPKRYRNTKECTQCKKIKKYEDFGVNRSKTDGYTYACKECLNQEAKDKYERTKPEVLERQREYYIENKEEILKRHSKYAKDGRKKHKPDPFKNKARMALRYAVKIGAIKKQPCEVCKTTINIHGHHEDYNKPLDVNWLCPKHHGQKHRLSLKE